MFSKIPARTVAHAIFFFSLVGMVVVACKPPFVFAMTFYVVEIGVFAVALAHAVADASRTRTHQLVPASLARNRAAQNQSIRPHN